MKHRIYFLAFAFATILLSCNDNRHADTTGKDHPQNPIPKGPVDTSNSMPISIDTADKMIQSYLSSINCPASDTCLTAVIFNADSLRKYLNDTNSTAGRITYVKFMFAHTLNYINNGGQNQNCGYSNNALTLIVVGYNAANNYVYNAQGMVMDKAIPCPHGCPTGGTAASYMLPISPETHKR